MHSPKNKNAEVLVYCAIFLAIGVAAGLLFAQPKTVEVVKTIEVPGPERVVEVEVEKIVVDPKDAMENARLSAELAGVTADRDRLATESARNLAGWRKTYELWQALRCNSKP